MDELRKCSKCELELPFDFFHKHKAGQHGLDSRCKICRKKNPRNKEQEATYYSANKEKILSKAAARYAANPEKHMSRAAAWRAAHPELAKKLRNDWAAKNPGKKKAWHAAWYANNLERERQKSRAWCKDNADKIKASSRAYRKSHPEKGRARMAKRRDQLDDVYIAGILRQGTILLKPHIPQELIEAKRAHLKLVRKLKKEKQNVG